MPATCANCGDVASATQQVTAGDDAVLVPYCESCFAQLLRLGTRQIAAMLASVLVAVTLLLTLPWVSPNWGRWMYLAVSATACALPALLVGGLRRPEARPQTSDGHAVWWAGPKRLCCTREEFARSVAHLNQAVVDSALSRPPVLRPMMWLGVMVVVLLGPSTYDFLHPRLRVLNLTSPELELFDGTAPLGRVPASSLESPAAGLEVRLGVGVRELRAIDQTGKVIARRVVTVSAGKTYLYAPRSTEYCFWLERDHYGRADASSRAKRVRRLPRERDFWVLPEDIDTWFAQNPEPAEDKRSSGGSLTALRHARCVDAANSAHSR